jgi:hypothetical protein
MPDVRDPRYVAPVVALVFGCLAGCTGGSGGAAQSGQPPDTTVSVDSIVLERTVCFGFCPAYRVRIAGSGQVHFALTHPRDSLSMPQTDSIAPSAVLALLREAREIRFFELPAEIDPAHPEVCPVAATDHPSAIITIAHEDSVTRVHHYHGCYAERDGEPTDAFPRLTAFENAIDSAVRVERWLPPRE